MNKMFKRTVSVIAAAGTIIGCMSVSAAWEFAGYDTTNPMQYTKVYNEKIDGDFTSKQKTEPVKDEDVEWKFEGYELAYPHTGYQRLYLEGNAQNAVTRLTNLYPQWETRYRDFLWEVCGDHRIYQRQQTKINSKYWAWDFGNEALGVPDSDVFVPTTRFADTTDEFKARGIMNLDLDGNYVYDTVGNVYNEELYTVYQGPFTNAMPKAFKVVLDEEGNPTKEIAYGDFLHIDNLSRINPETGLFEVTDEMIAEYLDIPATKYTTGPSYYGENPTKDVAKIYFENIDSNWNWDSDVAVVEHNADIKWTDPVYEMAEPYYYYQFLVVNGLVLDGRNDTPCVKRYTGGKADPKVEWRYCYAQADYPYEVVEVKFIEGNDGKMIMAVDSDLNPVVRIPTGKYANSYFVITDTDVELWIKDDVNSYKIATYPRNEGPFGDVYSGYTGGANYIG